MTARLALAEAAPARVAPEAEPRGLPDEGLPDEAPLDMPTQSFRRAPARRWRLPTSPRGIWLRRALVLGLTLAITLAAAREFYRALEVGGLTTLEGIVLGLFILLSGWIGFAFSSALAGFCVLLAGGGHWPVPRDGPLPALETRTAILLPTYNESPLRVAAGLQTIHESLAATGSLDAFDVFILSDTTDPAVWLQEEAAFLALRRRLGGEARIFYRHRSRNIDRKAGNIAEWVGRFGGAYPQMLVLDADSLMSGDTIVRLAGAMERHPGIGLIQTLPVIVNGSSLFARLQQFAGRVYGPLIAQGLAWWHGAESNYWGHNAIIRTRAFAEQAGLPHLSGRRPFGGHILSHDFVEAALLRRGGWAVHLVPALGGSYEESPPSLTELSLRDRRWCQGNLQHAGVLPARGLHWVSRLHLLTGIGSYLTAPLWLLFLLAGIVASLQARFVRPEYFPKEFSLFPQWPAQDPERALWVFAATMGLLLAPKLLAWLALLLRPADRRGAGGALGALASLLLETLLAGLLAPVTMLAQSSAVVSILAGRDAGWQPQRRDDGSFPLAQVAERYMPHTLFGLLLGAGAYAVSPALLLWTAPVVLGLALAIPLALLTAARGPGLWLRRHGLLLIPEELEPPPLLRRARQLQGELADDPAAAGVAPLAVPDLLADARLLAAHRRLQPPPRRRGQGPIDPALVLARAKLDDADSLPQALAGLTRPELAAALADPGALDRMEALARAA